MRRIVSIDGDTVTVQPGVVLGQLNRYLAGFGRQFGPDPATGGVTTMGSVLALDNSGSNWLRHGSARRHVVSMQIVMADGEVLEAGRHPITDDPLRDPHFSISDRSRWSGEAFGLTADWIYPWLTDAQKRDIRTVFLRWADELSHAGTTSHNHPEPIGVFNDKRLTRDRTNVRWSSNNYFTAHARNLGLMAMALTYILWFVAIPLWGLI